LHAKNKLYIKELDICRNVFASLPTASGENTTDAMYLTGIRYVHLLSVYFFSVYTCSTIVESTGLFGEFLKAATPHPTLLASKTEEQSTSKKAGTGSIVARACLAQSALLPH
jgi:hypothetical protein